MADAKFLIVLLLLSPAIITGEEVIKLKLEYDSVEKDDYYCTSTRVPGEGYVVGYNPHMLASVVHHMILYGCADAQTSTTPWNCMREGICSKSSPEILFAWALQADGLQLPKDVGFQVGGSLEDAIQYLVMEVHYHDKPNSTDMFPALDVTFTKDRMPYLAAIYLIGRDVSGGLLPGMKNVTLDGACSYDGDNSIVPFAFRTHAHEHGTAMYGYVVDDDFKWTLIGQRNPQDPQAFYPVVNSNLVINPGDIIAARTYYNTENEDSNIHFGAHGDDEMSNFYFMYYTANNDVPLNNQECWSEAPPTLIYPESDGILPLHEAHHNHTHVDNAHTEHMDHASTNMTAPGSHSNKETTPTPQIDDSWPYNNGFNNPIAGITIGQISAVDVDDDNNVYILHRSNVLWEAWSFDENNVYASKLDGPIVDFVLVKLDSTGSYVSSWGSGMFYMPHGLRVNNDEQYWITDVARHQIIKNVGSKISVLGEAFVPGTDMTHFCKPADILVDEINGVFYIADGYCNHRVVAYTLKGEFLYQLDSVIDGKELSVPHSLSLTSDGSQLFVADRENGRIVMYDLTTKIGRVFTSNDQLNGFIYAIAFGNHDTDWPLYAINGSADQSDSCYGFTINEEGVVVGTWGPSMGFNQPHDIAVTKDGRSIYVGQLNPAKVWRFTISDTPTTSSDVSNTSSHSLPIPTVNSVTISLPNDNDHNDDGDDGDDGDDEDYSCPRPPPPPTVTPCVSCSPFVQSSPFIIDDTPANGLSLYVILISAGGAVWLVFICCVCVALCCAKKVNTILLKQNGGIVNRHYATDPKRKLRSLLNKNNRKGFNVVSAVDSDSDTELTVFQKT